MKKRLALLLGLVLVMSVFVACSNNTDQPQETEDQPVETVEDDTTQVEEEPTTDEEDEEVADTQEALEIAEIGIGSVTNTERSKDGDEENSPVGQADVTVVAAAFDSNGAIVDVNIDVAQSKIEFDEEGQPVIEDEYLTKIEQGDDYGMRAASEIDAEYDEQIEHLESQLIGMTMDEVNALELEDQVPTDEDILAGTTIKIESYLQALNKAYENRQDAQGATKFGSGIVTTPNSRSERSVTINTTFAVVGLDDEDKFVSVSIDTVQPQVAIDEENAVVETFAEVETKKEQEDDYNMRGASDIEKEWYEQMEAWEQYLVGKTIDEINNMEYTQRDEAHQYVPADPDLASSVTITVENYNAAVEKAVEDAQ